MIKRFYNYSACYIASFVIRFLTLVIREDPLLGQHVSVLLISRPVVSYGKGGTTQYV